VEANTTQILGNVKLYIFQNEVKSLVNLERNKTNYIHVKQDFKIIELYFFVAEETTSELFN